MEVKNSELNWILSEIETEVKRLLEENTRLRNEIKDLKSEKVNGPESSKLISLEEEVRKLRRTVEDLQNQQMSNRDRIFQIRTLIQEEIKNKKNRGSAQSISERDIQKNFSDEEEIRAEEERVGYSPYISVDEENHENSITHQSLVEEDVFTFPKKNEGSSFKSPSESKQTEYKEPLSKGVTKTKQITTPSEQTLSKENSPFLINDFTDEEDPFGDEESKIEDDDFFKSKSDS